jgi:phosphate transport system protein
VGAIATELERIGDYASHIAASVFQQSDTMAEMAWSEDIEQMTALVQRMLRESLEAFLNQDAEQARHLGTLDEEVDALRDNVQFALVQQAQGNIHYLNSILAMLNVVHVLERAADRATNIGERVIYIISSNMEEINA